MCSPEANHTKSKLIYYREGSSINEQETSQRDVNIDVSDVATAAVVATDEARESRDVTVEPLGSKLKVRN